MLTSPATLYIDDLPRQCKQLQRLMRVMADCRVRRLCDMARDAECPEASVSARWREVNRHEAFNRRFECHKQRQPGGWYLYWCERRQAQAEFRFAGERG